MRLGRLVSCLSVGGIVYQYDVHVVHDDNAAPASNELHEAGGSIASEPLIVAAAVV